MICTKKIYGFTGQIIEKRLDITPMTDRRTENEMWKTGDPGGPRRPISPGGSGGPCDLRGQNGQGYQSTRLVRVVQVDQVIRQSVSPTHLLLKGGEPFQ